VKKDDGSRTIGTVLDPKGKAIADVVQMGVTREAGLTLAERMMAR
jgi:hypothetical protein